MAAINGNEILIVIMFRLIVQRNITQSSTTGINKYKSVRISQLNLTALTLRDDTGLPAIELIRRLDLFSFNSGH